MKKYRFVWLVVIGIGGLFIGVALASGAADAPQPDRQEEVQAFDSAAVPAVQTGDNPCLDCHTDELRLKELAVEEETEDLSEGPG